MCVKKCNALLLFVRGDGGVEKSDSRGPVINFFFVGKNVCVRGAKANGGGGGSKWRTL